MARYAVEMREMLKGKVVVELGCGCGVPGLAAGR
jgi:predicted RNA methylase